MSLDFIFIPATMVAYLGIPQEKSDAEVGLVDFVRNIGAKRRHVSDDYGAGAPRAVSLGNAREQYQPGQPALS